jgi:uncharacterized RDD family membrane protein YckC
VPVLDDMAGELGGRAAGFWRRFVASLIDSIVLGVVTYALRAAVSSGFGLFLSFVISAGYFTWFHGRTGQTPGDAALGIRVVDERDRIGQPIGYNRAFVRWLVSIVSGLVLVLGYLWMLWDSRKQTWHDKAAGSLPVHVGY